MSSSAILYLSSVFCAVFCCSAVGSSPSFQFQALNGFLCTLPLREYFHHRQVTIRSRGGGDTADDGDAERTHTHTLRYTHIHAGTHICKPISTHAHSTPSSSTHTPIHTCTQITDPHVSTHKNTSKHTCTCTHAHTHTYMHIHTCIHTCTYTHAYTYTRTYTHNRIIASVCPQPSCQHFHRFTDMKKLRRSDRG